MNKKIIKRILMQIAITISYMCLILIADPNYVITNSDIIMFTGAYIMSSSAVQIGFI